MKYRRWLPEFNPGLRTTVNLSETYRDHRVDVYMSILGEATVTYATYVDGRKIAIEVVIGSSQDVLLAALIAGMNAVDRALAG